MGVIILEKYALGIPFWAVSQREDRGWTSLANISWGWALRDGRPQIATAVGIKAGSASRT